MPCRSDFMEPNGTERETTRVAKNLVYIFRKLKQRLPDGIKQNTNYYPDTSKLDEYTALLCATIKKLTPVQRGVILYDGRKAEARELADWWQNHQKVDKRRKAIERAEKQRRRTPEQIKKLKASALKKLTRAEREVLDI